MKRGKTPILTITNREGIDFDSPQTMLNEIISPLTFDPNEWMFKPDKEQLESLKKLVDADGKIANLEGEHKALFDKRTVAGREKDRTEAVFEKLPLHKDAPKEVVSHADLLKDYEDAKRLHTKVGNCDLIDKAQHVRLDIIQKAIRKNELERQDLYQDKKELETAMANNIKEQKELVETLPDLEEKKTALDNAESINERVRANQARETASIAATNAYKAHAELESKVKAKKEAINKAVRESDMPVEGMTFGEDCILLDNRELKSCSTGEQIVASLKISMALNKGLRTIMIKDGSLLDADNRKLVMEFAKEHGFQVIMEVVTEGKSVTIEIEGVD